MADTTWETQKFTIQWLCTWDDGVDEWMDGTCEDGQLYIFKTEEEAKKRLQTAKNRQRYHAHQPELRLVREVRTFDVIA